jgi:HD superfamily phosphohydrolase
MKYIERTSKLIKDYFNILSPDYPDWLDEYIETERMLKQQYISVTCGKIYSKLFDYNDYSSLDHSIAVALIIWNFTHDKKQTLSGLFHDIATPAFKHCIDFLNGDYMNQESTEELTKTLIKDSKDIMKLLERDNIELDEVCEYHIYPIADNDTPMLSADRLEYSLSNALFTYRLLNSESIKEIYNDINIQKNEENEIELGFKTKK